MAIENLKRHKSPGVDQIPADLIKQRVEHFALRPTDINSIWNKE
jgi:hypothetical protein